MAKQWHFLMLLTAFAMLGCQEETPEARRTRELYERLRAFGLGHSVGDPPTVLAFDCDSRDASAGPCIDVHIVEARQDKIAPSCDCEDIERVMETLTACCAGTPGAAHATCNNGTFWKVNCRENPSNPMEIPGHGPDKPEISIFFPGGFSRNLWPCTVDGARNPDFVALERVHDACCKN